MCGRGWSACAGVWDGQHTVRTVIRSRDLGCVASGLALIWARSSAAMLVIELIAQAGVGSLSRNRGVAQRPVLLVCLHATMRRRACQGCTKSKSTSAVSTQGPSRVGTEACQQRWGRVPFGKLADHSHGSPLQRVLVRYLGQSRTQTSWELFVSVVGLLGRPWASHLCAALCALTTGAV